MPKIAHVSGKGRAATHDWQAPVVDGKFSTAFGSNFVEQFVAGHTAGGVLTELIQNEYDAGGRRLSVEFTEDTFLVRGNGRPIDSKGWERLSVVFGTGRVVGAMREDIIEAKQNGIGSKNLGLRSLFFFGNRIHVSSAGKQAVLDLPVVGVASAADGTTRGLPGVTIRVPYRLHPFGSLPPFSVDAEASALEHMRSALPFSLVKLAEPRDQGHSLNEVMIRSERLNQTLSWRQSATRLRSPAKATVVIQRTVQVRETSHGGKLEARRLSSTLTEIEFQRSLLLPDAYRLAQIPGYFQRSKKCIRLGLSVRLRGGKLDVTTPGIFYYPLGLPDRHTGLPVSVSAPFSLNSDRSQLLEQDWNRWLMEQAAALMVELLTTDWYKRFGVRAYLLANRLTVPAFPWFHEAILTHLKTDDCWPSRAVVGRSMRPKLVRANRLVVVDDRQLDGFLADQRYLDRRLNDDETIRALAVDSGALRFTLNSAVRLKCGPTNAQLATKPDKNRSEANCFYNENNYESILKHINRQKRFADCFLGLWKQLTDANKKDLKESASTLTSDGNVRPARELWLIRSEISDGVTVPPELRLHPTLASSPLFTRLCREFDVSQWALDITARLKTQNPPSENERAALYQLLLRDSTAVKGKARGSLRTAAVVRNHRGEWVAPARLKLVRGRSAEILEPVLHFPPPELVRSPNAAKVWQFKKTIDAQDLVAFAKIVAGNPQLAAGFEETLSRHRALLTRKTVQELATVAFLRCTGERIAAPIDVYLRTHETEACLGSGGLFPAGNRRKLYETLECQTRPSTKDILLRLQELRGEDKPPAQPLILYSCLREAMRREKRDVTELANASVLWTTKGYATPTLTLVGRSVPRSLRRYLPVCRDPLLEETYQALGARNWATTDHWRHFFGIIHQKYQAGNRRVEDDDKAFLLDAYGQPRASEAISGGMKILLDDSGALHSQGEALTGAFVLNDAPELAEAIQHRRIPISFAVTELHQLAVKLHLKRLSELRGVPQVRLGLEHRAPDWFQPPLGGIERALQSGLANAIGVVLQTQFGLSPRTARATQQRLGAVSKIAFVDSFAVEYPLVGASVSVNGEAWLSEDTLYLVPVSSPQELHDLVADALANGLSLGLGIDDIRTFATVLQRLLSCRSRTEMGRVLRRRGIPWEPTDNVQAIESSARTNDADLDHGLPDETASVVEHIRQSLLADLHSRSSVQSVTMNGEGDLREATVTASSTDDSTPPGGEPEFPDITEVELILQPSDSLAVASPPNGPPRSRRDGTAWSPPTQQEQARDRRTGERGEELVYLAEVKRVTALGYPPSSVIWASKYDPAADYDIQSVADDGRPLWIEVKSTLGTDGQFTWPRNEFLRALQAGDHYEIWRVYNTGSIRPVAKRFRYPIHMLSLGQLRLDVASLAVEVESA